MKKIPSLFKHLIGISSILISIIFLIASSSVKNIGTVSFNSKNDDLFSKDALKSLIKKKQSPSVLIRNLNSYSFQTVSKTDPSNVLINSFERTLLKNNFSVRDRALFEKSYNQAQGVLDYSKMSELTNTDLIMEIIGFSNVTYTTNMYTSKTLIQKTLPVPYNITQTGLKLDIKLIHVKTNEIVGTYTFYELPCVGGCALYKYPKSMIYQGGGVYSLVAPKTAPSYNLMIDDSRLQEFVDDVTTKFVEHLKAD